MNNKSKLILISILSLIIVGLIIAYFFLQRNIEEEYTNYDETYSVNKDNLSVIFQDTYGGTNDLTTIDSEFIKYIHESMIVNSNGNYTAEEIESCTYIKYGKGLVWLFTENGTVTCVMNEDYEVVEVLFEEYAEGGF